MTVGNVTIFHSGDTHLINYYPDLAYYLLADKNIDVAFIPAYWLGWNGTTNMQGVINVQKYINANKYVLMHMQQVDIPYYLRLADVLATNIIVSVFQTPLETQAF